MSLGGIIALLGILVLAVAFILALNDQWGRFDEASREFWTWIPFLGWTVTAVFIAARDIFACRRRFAVWASGGILCLMGFLLMIYNR